MKKLKKQIQILLLLCLLFICAACGEDYDDVTYYKTVGIGYVFMYDTLGNLQPVRGAEITVINSLGYSGGFLSPPNPKETFITDETGKYQVRFIKRTQKRDVQLYSITLATGFIFFQCEPKDVKDAKNNIYIIPDFIN